MPRTTSFTLGEEREAFLREQVEAGKYGSVSEALRTLIDKDMEEEKKEEWLLAALKEGEEGEGIPHDEVWAGLRKEFPWLKSV